MRVYDLRHLSDPDLLNGLETKASNERGDTAEVLAHIGEVDGRRLYLPLAYPSMQLYCVHRLHFSEDAAKKRIQAARIARRFPALFVAIEEGRLHFTAVVLLAPHLNESNTVELIESASFRTKLEIQTLLAERFPKTELLALVGELPSSNRPADQTGAAEAANGSEGALAHLRATSSFPRVKPLAHKRFELHVSISDKANEALFYAQALLSHAIPSGDLAQVLERLIQAGIPELEKSRFAATNNPRTVKGASSENPRHLPAHVKRAVWRRDGGQCTFTSDTGRRCEERRFVELDHVVPVARGGRATIENLRLRCRAHNQFEADRSFGKSFMDGKRVEARRSASERGGTRMPVRPDPTRDSPDSGAVTDHSRDVMEGLRSLGFRAEQARRAVEYVDTIAEATLEMKMRAALAFLCPKRTSGAQVAAAAMSA